ncbi:MAG: hypothetical protein ACRC1P_09550 [Cellulosilyticaceae bacterium]
MIKNKDDLIKHLEGIGFYDSVSKCYARYNFVINDEDCIVFIQRCPRAKDDNGSWAARNKGEVSFYDYMIDFVYPDGLYRTKESFSTVEEAIDEWIKEENYPFKYSGAYTTWEVWKYRK